MKLFPELYDRVFNRLIYYTSSSTKIGPLFKTSNIFYKNCKFQFQKMSVEKINFSYFKNQDGRMGWASEADAIGKGRGSEVSGAKIKRIYNNLKQCYFIPHFNYLIHPCSCLLRHCYMTRCRAEFLFLTSVPLAQV